MGTSLSPAAFPLSQVIPGLSRLHTVGNTIPDGALRGFGALATAGATGLITLVGLNLASFVQSSLLAPAPYLVASAAARSRKDYGLYKGLAILAAVLFMPGTTILGALGAVVGYLWMFSKLEKHLKFQDKSRSRRRKKRKRQPRR